MCAAVVAVALHVMLLPLTLSVALLVVPPESLLVTLAVMLPVVLPPEDPLPVILTGQLAVL